MLLGITSGEAAIVRSVLEHVLESNGELDDLLADIAEANDIINSIIEVGAEVEPVPVEELEEIIEPCLDDECYLDDEENYA